MICISESDYDPVCYTSVRLRSDSDFIRYTSVFLILIMILFTVFPAFHTQYIFRTDPLSSGAASHATQVHPDDQKALLGAVQRNWRAPLPSGVSPSQSIPKL